jgi:hypothetical protein
MLSIGLWLWYINITIITLDIFHRPVFYLKHDVLDNWFSLRLQVEPTQVGPVEEARHCHRTQTLKTETECSLRNVVF